MANEIYTEMMLLEKTMLPSTEIRVVDNLPWSEVQARRHKRKSNRRWQKKWLKRFGTKLVPPMIALQVGNVIYVSPEMMESIDSKLKSFKNTFLNNLNGQLFYGRCEENKYILK